MVSIFSSSISPVIAVFGGSGFIGRLVVQKLAERGATVRLITRDRARAQRLSCLGEVGQITPVVASIDQEQSISTVINGCDGVINLIGILEPSRRYSFTAIHHQWPERLARVCSQAKIRRLVHVSSTAASMTSRSAYARSKARGDKAILKHYPEAVILRPAAVFGAQDQFLSRFFRLSSWSPVLPVLGSRPHFSLRPPWLHLLGLPGRSDGVIMAPVYVGDIAQAIVEVLDRGAQKNKSIYYILGPKSYTLASLLRLLLRAAGRRRLLLPLPLSMMQMIAVLFGWVPGAVTLDQVRLLRELDNLSQMKLKPSLNELGIRPIAVESMLDQWYRPQ